MSILAEGRSGPGGAAFWVRARAGGGAVATRRPTAVASATPRRASDQVLLAIAAPFDGARRARRRGVGGDGSDDVRRGHELQAVVSGEPVGPEVLRRLRARRGLEPALENGVAGAIEEAEIDDGGLG